MRFEVEMEVVQRVVECRVVTRPRHAVDDDARTGHERIEIVRSINRRSANLHFLCHVRQMRKRSAGVRHQPVDDHHLVAALHEPACEMAAEKAGATEDENAARRQPTQDRYLKCSKCSLYAVCATWYSSTCPISSQYSFIAWRPTRLPVASMVLMQAIRVYLEPVVNSATAHRTRITATNEFQRTFAVIILLGTLPLVLFPYNMLSVLFTSAFTPVSALLFVFVLSDCVFLCGQVYATVVMAVDDFKAYFAANVAGYVCLCLCVWLSIDRFGMAGIAWSFVAARALVFVLIQALLFWRHRLTMTVRAAGVVVYTIVVLAAVASLFGSARVVDVQAVLLRLLAFGAIAVGTLAFLTQAERAWLGAACRRLTEAR